MGIKNLNRRLVEIGKIKTGGKNPNKTYKGKDGNQHRAPVRWDHFEVTELEKDSKDNFVTNEEIMKELGPSPKALEILLLSDDIDSNFMTSYALYRGSKCVCRGDGEMAQRTYLLDEEGKELPGPEIRPIICDTTTCPFFLDGKCKPGGVLSCMLPQTKKIGGVYKYRTHSWNSIVNITSSLEAIKIMTGGVLFGIPLKMELIDKQTEEFGKVKVVNIVFNGDIKQLQIEASRQKQLRIDGSVSMTSQNALVKSSGVLQDQDDPADIQDEFYPEGESKEPGVDGGGLAAHLEDSPGVNESSTPAGESKKTPEKAQAMKTAEKPENKGASQKTESNSKSQNELPIF